MKHLPVALLGSKFMGRAHSNAWMSVAKFFELPLEPTMAVVAARDAKATAAFAARWGMGAGHGRLAERGRRSGHRPGRRRHSEPRPRRAGDCVPGGRQARRVREASGGHARRRPRDADAARAAKRRGVQTFVWFNYRRCPAVAFARELVAKGRLGEIFHVRASYLQDWGGPSTPLLWRFNAAEAGSGAHGDLNAHIVDMARFITGDEVGEVVGAIEHTFVKERAIVEDARSRGALAASSSRKAARRGATRRRRTGRSTVDDCVLFLARFRRGAVASFEATRLATGNQNRNQIEINGGLGSIKFDFERMNELLWWDHTLPPAERGWSRIMCTTPGAHPYVDAYWPPAHVLGYEHGFVSEAADIVKAIAGRKPVAPLPDFEDAWKTQCVLEAALRSARERGPVAVASVA